MELVNVTQLRPGQSVASPVTNAGGAVLCPEGFELTEAAIERLRNAGVESVMIEANENTGSTTAELQEMLGQRFQGIDDPLMLQIKAVIEKRINFLDE